MLLPEVVQALQQQAEDDQAEQRAEHLAERRAGEAPEARDHGRTWTATIVHGNGRRTATTSPAVPTSATKSRRVQWLM